MFKFRILEASEAVFLLLNLTLSSQQKVLVESMGPGARLLGIEA